MCQGPRVRVVPEMGMVPEVGLVPKVWWSLRWSQRWGGFQEPESKKKKNVPRRHEKTRPFPWPSRYAAGKKSIYLKDGLLRAWVFFFLSLVGGHCKILDLTMRWSSHRLNVSFLGKFQLRSSRWAELDLLTLNFDELFELLIDRPVPPFTNGEVTLA